MSQVSKDSKIASVELPPTQFGRFRGQLAYDIYSMSLLPPRALPTLDAVLRRDGFTNTRQVNPYCQGKRGMFSDDNLRDAKEADVLLVSSITRTARQTAYFIRERKANKPGIIVLAGGPDATARPEFYLNAGADVVVRGEGEKTLSSIMERLVNGSRELDGIEGIAFRRNGDIVLTAPAKLLSIDELNEMPSPFYDESTRRRAQVGTVEGSRGCPNNCDYCYVPSLYGQSYRMKSAKKVMADLMAVHDMGYATFFTDDNIARSPKRIELFQAIAESGLKKWNRLFQADVQTMLNDKMRQALWDAGFKVWCAGIESFSDETLRNLGKPYTAEQNRQAIKVARDQGFWVHAMMMVGGDGDTQDTLDYTLNFLKRNVDSVQLFIPTPLPGTRFTRAMREQGRLLDPDFEKPYLTDGSHVLIRPVNFTPYELQKKVFEMYREFYSYREGFRRLFSSARPSSTAGITLYCNARGLSGAIDSPQTRKHKADLLAMK